MTGRDIAQLFRTFETPPWKREDTVIATIGNFDGVHTGHRALLQRVAHQAKAQNAISVAMSFYPHPAVRLGKIASMPLITSLHQKLVELGKIRLGYLCHIHFTKEFSELSAAQFIELVLIKHLNVSKVILGPDACVGHKREGTPEFIQNYMQNLKREAEIISAVESECIKVSSRQIRDLVGRGEIEKAAELLGRPFAIDGRVSRGAGRGGKIGVPTANLLSGNHLLPKNGVYATRAHLHATVYNAVTNVGVRPTFGGDLTPAAETHIFGLPNLPLYGKRIEIEFVERIRDEAKFSGVQELTAQIQLDILKARSILEGS